MRCGAACGAYIRSLAAKPVFNVLKLVLLCILVCWAIQWCNQSSVTRWTVAVALVAGCRLFTGHVVVHIRHLRPGQHDSTSAQGQPGRLPNSGAFAKQIYVNSPRGTRQPKNRDEWRAAVGSPQVASAWEKLCNSIVQEFIYDSWFCQLSPDREFPAYVRWQLNHAFGEVCKRAQSKRLDWTSILIRDCSAAVCSTLQLYRSASEIVGAEKLKALPAADADVAIRDVLSTARKLHPAFYTSDGQYRACTRLSDAVLTHILPQEDRACPMMRTLLRELFATCLLRSTLASLAPYSVNRMLLNIMGAGTSPKPLSQEQLDDAAEFEQRGSLSCKAEEDHLKQLRAEEKSRKSLLPAASKQQYSPAQSVATFSNSMKRSKSLGDVKEALSKPAGRSAGRPTASLTPGKQPGSRWRENNVSPVRGATAVLAVGQQGQQMLAGGVGAVKAAAQQLTQRRRVGSDARLGSKPLSSPASSLPADSPRSCTSAAELSCSPDLVSRLAAVARGMSTGGLGFSPTGLGFLGDHSSSAASSISGSAVGNTAGMSPAVPSSGNSSTSGSNNMKTPMVAALCGMGRPPFSPTGLQGSAGPVMQQLMFGKLHAQVINAEMLSQDGKDVIVYKVRVADERAEWIVTRRYRHFETLHKRLKDSRHYKDLPVALPPKRLLTARDAPFVLKRRDELDAYLQGLLSSQCLASNFALAEFLSQNSEVYGMAAAADRLQSIRTLAEGSSPAQRTQSEDVQRLSSCQGALSAEQQFTVQSSSINEGNTERQQQQQLPARQPELAMSNTGKCSSCEVDVTASISSGSNEEIKYVSARHTSCSSGLPAANSSAMLNTLNSTSGCMAGQQGIKPTLESAKKAQVVHNVDTEYCQQQHSMLVVDHAAAAAIQAQNCNNEMLLHKQQNIGMQQKPHQLTTVAKALQEQWPPAAGESVSRLGCGDTMMDLSTARMQENQQRQQQHYEARFCQQQPRRYSGHQQPGLKQADAVRPDCVAQQAAVAPHLPSSAPVPNRVLPQPSTTLDSMGSARCPGAPCDLSRQESDAAHHILEAQQPTVHPSRQQRSTGIDCSSLALTGSSNNRLVADPQQQQHCAGRAAAAGSSMGPVELHANTNSGAKAGTMGRSGNVPSSPSETLQAHLQQQSAQCTSASAQLVQQQTGMGNCNSSSTQQPHANKGLAVSAGATSEGSSEHCCVMPPEPTAEPGSIGEHWCESEEGGWQNRMQDSTGLIEPLYELVSCAFELQNRGFVRRPVFAGVRGLLSFVAGGAVDEFVQKKLKTGLSEENLSRQLHRIQAQLWPGGVFFARANAAAAAAAAGSARGGLPTRGPPIAAEKFLDWVPPPDCDEVAAQVRQRLIASSVPGPLLALLGRQNYYKCLGDIFGVLQSKTLMYNLGLTLIETLLVAMWPEVKSTVKQMHAAGTVCEAM